MRGGGGEDTFSFRRQYTQGKEATLMKNKTKQNVASGASLTLIFTTQSAFLHTASTASKYQRSVKEKKTKNVEVQ